MDQIGYQSLGCSLNGNPRCWTTSHYCSYRTVICSPFVTSTISRLSSNLYHVLAWLRRFCLAIVDSWVDRTTPGIHLGVQMHAHSGEATSYLGLGPGVRCRMLDRSQMMWEFHKYRLEHSGEGLSYSLLKDVLKIRNGSESCQTSHSYKLTDFTS